MKRMDMHTHTTASDGRFTPRKLVDYAIKKELGGIAITDHDTIGGIDEAVIYCDKWKDFLIVAGIELSTEMLGEEVHILGYDIKYKSIELLDTLKLIQNQRLDRAAKIVKELQCLRIPISYDEVLKIAQEGVVGRPHIARALMNRGYVKTMEEAFKKYLNKGCPAYVPRYKLNPYEAIDLIRKVGGLAVLAHPGLIINKVIIDDILNKGIDGIEAFHPQHKKEDSERFLSMAEMYNLIITGGSDFHNPPMDDDKHGDLGSETVLKEYIRVYVKGIVR